MLQSVVGQNTLVSVDLLDGVVDDGDASGRARAAVDSGDEREIKRLLAVGVGVRVALRRRSLLLRCGAAQQDQECSDEKESHYDVVKQKNFLSWIILKFHFIDLDLYAASLT